MKNIIQTELGYINQFATKTNDGGRIRFCDSQLPDMYSHNLTYLTNITDNLAYENALAEEKQRAKELGKDFLVIRMDGLTKETRGNILGHAENISVYGYYKIQLDTCKPLIKREDLSFKRVTTANVSDAKTYDFEFSKEEMGEDFTIRRFERRSKVYISDGSVDSFLLYLDQTAVCSCDLYIENGVAKFEDFTVTSSMQHQGIGTTMLANLMELSKSKGAHTAYVITDEDDTAKEMYQKCGFKKCGELTEIFYPL